MYRLYKYLTWKPSQTSTQVQQYIDTELPNVTPVDNSSASDPETISDSEANLIANNLETYMTGAGTNTSSLMSAIECLNGASLNKVYAAFGTRSYPAVYFWEDDTDRDLFGWFAAELENAPFSSMIYYQDCVPSCTSYWDMCRETDYMRAIWTKSSVQITF